MEKELNHTEKFVVLEHLNLPRKGMRFVTKNVPDNTHGYGGVTAYKEVLFTDDEKEAIEAAEITGDIPSPEEVRSFYIEADKNKHMR